MNVTHGIFWVNLPDGEPQKDIIEPEDMYTIDASNESKSFWYGADFSEQMAFASVKINAATPNLGEILKEIIDALTKLANAQGIKNAMIKFEVMKEDTNDASRRYFGKKKHVHEIGVDDFLSKF